MGLLELIYPTATHNRFSHSIATAWIALKMLQTLKKNYELNNDEPPTSHKKITPEQWDDIEKYVFVGALLHDIGHGPFSHAFETFVKNKKDEILKHEGWTKKFLYEHDYQELLCENDIEADTLFQLIEGEFKPNNKNKHLSLAQDIISSQMDADRIDYLLRDSYFCGVKYGMIDIDYLLNFLVVIKDVDKPRIGIDKKSYRSIEHFFLSRKMMYQTTSFHNKNSILERLLIFFLEEYANFIADKKNSEKFEIPNIHLKEFLLNVVDYNNSNISAETFMNKNFTHYKQITEGDIWSIIIDCASKNHLNKHEQFTKIAKCLYDRDIPHSFEIYEGKKEQVETLIHQYIETKGLKKWEMFITKNEVHAYKNDKQPIFVEHKGSSREITYYSDTLKKLTEKEVRYYLAISREAYKRDQERIDGDFKPHIE